MEKKKCVSCGELTDNDCSTYNRPLCENKCSRCEDIELDEHGYCDQCGTNYWT